MKHTGLLLLAIAAAATVYGQSVVVREASPFSMPGDVDSNSPAFWVAGELRLLNSTGNGPLLSKGANQFGLSDSAMSKIFRPDTNWPTWIEATWAEPNGGPILAWYHQEHEYVCGSQRPAMPRIGAAISWDQGETFRDLGIVLESGDKVDCNSPNGYFSGGHGDFSVVLDRDQKYFYFLFSNYGGPLESQGVVTARMAYEDRYSPSGRVWKYYQKRWDEPGIGGTMTPVFPAKVSWQKQHTDSFWGPSVHWNTFLGSYVVLLNRSCCTPGWPQKGIYVSFNADIGNPDAWQSPDKILADTGWYPQVLGLGKGETDSVAGRTARLYVYGKSRWELVFRRASIPSSSVAVPVP